MTSKKMTLMMLSQTLALNLMLLLKLTNFNSMKPISNAMVRVSKEININFAYLLVQISC